VRIHAGRLGKQGERLSEEFLNSLLGWVHSGFSVHGEQTVPTRPIRAPGSWRRSSIPWI